MLGALAPEEVLEEYREKHGLNDPVLSQYWRFIQDVFHGDFGISLPYQEPVLPLLLDRVPVTVELSSVALAIGLVIGIPTGVFSAVYRNSWWDIVIRAMVMFGQAVPGFYLGLLLIIVFSVELRILPTGGRGGLKHLIMPSVTMSTYLVTLIVRFTRAAVLDVLSSDYVRTARAKGLRERIVLFRHVLKNALIPLTTVIGLQIAGLFGGSVITETIFAWPGVGRFTVQAIFSRDFPVLQTVILIMSAVIIIINLIVDILYSYMDPRIRFE
jgi:peptide/nickel transport system permease protein